jgi:serralysin
MGTYTGTSGDDNITGFSVSAGVVRVPSGSSPSDAFDTISGLAGNDYLDGGGGNDTLNGGTGDDTLYGRGGDDSLFGETGNDTINGGAGNDSLQGGGGNDSLDGDTGDDTINGGAGNDWLYGRAGNDKINGGAGTDHLVGDSGDDTYDFDATGDSAAGASRDVIHNFDFEDVDTGDKIDVSTIDANVNLAGNQSFKFIGTAPLTGAGQISVFDAAGGKTFIQLNTDSDLDPESEIQVNDGAVLATFWSGFDFIL